MDADVLRLAPGDDLRLALEARFRELMLTRGVNAACVVSAVGSLSAAVLRFAAQPQGTPIDGALEIVSLSGTLSLDGPHLHAAIADAQGRMLGGHVLAGCTVRTTAEIVLGLLPGWEFRRAPDARTGYAELVATPPPAWRDMP